MRKGVKRPEIIIFIGIIMNRTDQQKVLDAGFIIIRPRDISPISRQDLRGHEIWARTHERSTWFKYAGPFPTKTERDRFKKNLLKRLEVIED